jgi:transglutaminase-like putative cysteine protease
VTVTFSIRHVTTYSYSAEVNSSQSIAHLRPRSTESQTVRTSVISSDPFTTDRYDYDDVFMNTTTYLAVEHPHERWVVVAESIVDVDEPAAPPIDVPWENVVGSIHRGADGCGPDVQEMSLASDHVPISDELAAFARPSFAAGGLLVSGVRSLVERIFAEFVFDSTATDVSTPVQTVLLDRRGVCQDFAHLAIGCLRSLGLAARYVSGYLETEPAPGMAKLVGSDASHAWLSVFVPGFGWLDADPTNGVFPRGRHITVAWGRDYQDVAPTRGVVFGPPATQQVEVGVDVTRFIT